MRWLLNLAAIALFLLAVLFAKGWIAELDVSDALACIAGGLACWAAASFSPPATVGQRTVR